MNRQASASLVNQCRWQCLRVLANGPTPEQLVAAEMYLASLAPSPQASLFNQQHANSGVATRGQPSPVGCVPALSRNPE